MSRPTRQNGITAHSCPLAEDAAAVDTALTSLELASDRAEIMSGTARLRLDGRGTAIVAALLGAQGRRLRRVEHILARRSSKAESRFFGLLAEDNDRGCAFVARLDPASLLAVRLRGTTIRLSPRGVAAFVALLSAAPQALDRVARRLGVEAAPSGPSGLVEPNTDLGLSSSLTPLARRDTWGGPTGSFRRVAHSLGVFRHR